MKHIKKFESFGPKGKDLTTFVRFGGLDLKNQQGHGKDNFHSPPATRGFYAFPKIAQSLFLIGSLDVFQPGILPKHPDYTNFTDDDFKERSKHIRKIKQGIRKEFVKTDGDIWHHLGEYCKPNEVISRHNSWVKTSIATWQKAFSKSSLNNRYGEDFNGSTGRGENSINSTRGINGYYSKDEYEVFFDEKV